MFSCLQILEAFLWFVLITLLNVTLIILTLSVSRLLNLLLRLVAFLLFLNPQCLASISRWITADRKSGSAGMPRPISYAVFCLKKKKQMYTETDIVKLFVVVTFSTLSLMLTPFPQVYRSFLVSPLLYCIPILLVAFCFPIQVLRA